MAFDPIIALGLAGTLGLAAGCLIGRRRSSARSTQARDLERERFRDVLELAYDWLWETDADHRFVYLSDKFAEVTGQPVASFIGRTRLEMAAGEPGDPTWSQHLARLEAREPFEGLVYSARIHGLLRWYRVSGKPRFADDGRFLGYRGIAADVTESVLVERQVERQHRQLQRAIDAISHGVALFDADDRMLAANRAYRAVSPTLARHARPGVPFAELARGVIADGLFGDRDDAEIEARLAGRLAQHRRGGTIEQTYADGRVVLVSETWLESGELLLQWNDVTAFRRRERALSLLVEARAKERDVIEAAAEALAVGLGYRWGGVVRRLDDRRLRLLALWDAGEIVRDVEYELDGTPCAEAYASGACYYPAAVCERFPKDRMLLDLGAQAFRGQVLRSASGPPQAHVIAFDDKPDSPQPHDADLMDLIADWVGIELTRRETAEALAASEARFRDLVEIDTDWYWELDRDLRFTFLSEDIEQLTGLPAHALVGRKPWTLAGAYGGTGALERNGWPEIREAMLAGRPFREMRLSLPDAQGALRHLRISGRPLFDATGAFAGYRGIGADETAAVAAERARAESAAILAAIVDNMPEGVSIVDGDLSIAHYNARFQHMLELPDAVLARGRFEDVIRYNAERGEYGAGDIEAMVAERLALARHPQPHRFVRERPDGMAIEVRGNPLPGGGFVTTYADVTEHHRVQNALKASEARYRLISELTSDFLYSYRIGEGGETEIEWFAGRLPDGLDPERSPDETAVHMHRMVVSEDRAILKARHRRLAAGENSTDELRVVAADGTIRWLRSVARPELDPETGRLVRILGAAKDITQSKLTDQALREAKETAELANRTKSEFLANMSHELRTPLNAIIGFSELMANQVMGPLGNPRYQAYSRDIWDSGTHLLNIINDILDVSKAEAGMVDLAEEDLRVCDLAASALRLVRHRAEVGGVRLVEAIQDDLPCLYADSRRMKQILLNLLSNAVKFTPEGGEVHLKAEVRPDGWLEISVSDQGIGIAAHDIDRVLEPFTQADSSLSRRHEGTGLGLPLTRALVEMHGGRFTLQSELGEGTTARIELPAARLIHPEPEMTVPATA